MSAPQTTERPASMLRAVFASFGSLLSGKDKRRTKHATQTPADAEAAAPAAATPVAAPESAAPESAAPEAAAPEATVAAEPETTAVAEPEAVAEPAAAEPVVEPEVVEAEVVVAEIFEPQVVVSETGEAEVVVAETVVVAAVVTELPLANYDEASVASLRARLRNLSVAQLEQLSDYEKSHANRADVITMFERRIAKVQAEG